MRVLLHTGKGGVGKTSLALATALGAAECGHRVCVLSADSAHSLGDALGRPVGPRPVEVAPRVFAQEVAVLDELERSWGEIREWLRALLRADAEGLLVDEMLVLPGLEELVALRAVLEVEASGAYDVCVVDCAPTGSALRMLRLPDVLRFLMEGFFDANRSAARLLRPLASRVGAGRLVAPDSVFAAVERLYGDVESVRQLLLDTRRSSARLVVTPTRVVVEESRRLFAYLGLYGIATDAVLVNRVLPKRAAGGYFARWAERERSALQEIESSFPVPRLELTLRDREPLGVESLRCMAGELFGARDPAALLTRSRPIRLGRREGRTLLEIDLPHARPEEVDVTSHGDELHVRMRDAHRCISLPASIAGSPILSARLDRGVLGILFGP